MITEPDVTLTDYGLVLECAIFTYLLHKEGNRSDSVKPWYLLFFAATGTAALTGGTVHGFFLDEATMGYRVLWPTTLIAIGATGLAAWVIGAKLQFSPRIARWVCNVASLEFAGYATVVSLFAQTFFIAVINYLPAAIFLLIGFATVYRKKKARQILVGIVGLLLTFVAAAIQQAGIALHPVYFNHNALYHLIQALALFMMFCSFRWLTTARPI